MIACYYFRFVNSPLIPEWFQLDEDLVNFWYQKTTLQLDQGERFDIKKGERQGRAARITRKATGGVVSTPPAPVPSFLIHSSSHSSSSSGLQLVMEERTS